MRRLLTSATVALLLAAPALAQDAQPAQPAPAQEQPGNTAGPSDLLNSGYTMVDTDSLSSRLIGFPIYSSAAADAERIGEINDLIINEQGQIAAVVVGVGGFLGVGEKNVAVGYDQLQFTTADDNTERVVLETTREALNAAPEIELLEDEPATAEAPAATPEQGAQPDQTETGAVPAQQPPTEPAQQPPAQPAQPPAN